MGESWAWADVLDPHTLGTPRTPEFNTGPAQIMHTHYENLPMQYTEIFFSCKN